MSYLLKERKANLEANPLVRMEANSNQPLIPQTEEDIIEVRWINRENLSPGPETLTDR